MFEESFRKLLLIERTCLRDLLIIDGCDAWPIVRHRLWATMTATPSNSSSNQRQTAKKTWRLLVSSSRVITRHFSKSVADERINGFTQPTVFTFGRYQHFVLDHDDTKRKDRVLGPIAEELAQQFQLEQFVLDNSSIESSLDSWRQFRRAIPTSNFRIRGLFSSGLVHECQKQGINRFRLVVSLFFDGLLFVSARKSMKRYCTALPHPSFALIDTWYSSDMMGIISVLRELNVNIIEIQHGFIHPNHAMYINWPNDSIYYKSIRPNAFWSWSNLAKNLLDIETMPCHTGKKVFVGGYPWVYLQVEKFAGATIRSDEELSLIEKRRHRTQVLITLGAPQIVGCEDLPESLLTVIRNRQDVSFVLLPHPNVPNFQNYLNYKFNYVLPKNVYVAPINSNLYSILGVCTHHITAMSSVALESSALRVPSLVIGKIGMELFNSLIDNKWLFATDSDDQVINNFLMEPNRVEKVSLAYVESSIELLHAAIERCKVLARL